jgi:2-polyprenyl-3-methyl-5-hydroxy-6-metoxy-1,4-benzoquinol methylase
VIIKHSVQEAHAKQKYLLGHSEPEIKRLQCQADILEPITKRLFQGAAIVPGMRILDVGCGAGDVSFLAGRLMGNLGEVVGVDANPAVLDIARARAKSARIPNVEFIESPVDAFYDEKAFDAVVGRFFSNPSSYSGEGSVSCHFSASPRWNSCLS